MTSRRLVKIALPLDEGYGAEAVWAEPVAPPRYRVRHSPFYAQDVSAQDIVFADDDHATGLLRFRGIAGRGGHSTYRVTLNEPVPDDLFAEYWGPIKALGCGFQQSGPLLAVDVPPSADVRRAVALLEDGAAAGVWEFEEGHCGHLVS